MANMPMTFLPIDRWRSNLGSLCISGFVLHIDLLRLATKLYLLSKGCARYVLKTLKQSSALKLTNYFNEYGQNDNMN